MRTWLVLAAVLVVAAAAVADAVQRSLGTSVAAKPPLPPAVSRIVPPGVPAGFMGTVYYSDLKDGCRLKTLRLAGFADAKAPSFNECRFSLSPDASSAGPAGAAWSPRGGVVAIPRLSRFLLGSPAWSQPVQVRGTLPAFKPDGTLTYVRGSYLVEWTTQCARDEHVITLPGPPARGPCVRRLLSGPPKSVAWLTESRFAAITADDELALVDHGRTLLRRPLPPGSSGRVEASPRRTFFTLWLDGHLAGAFDRNGAAIAVPPVPNVRSVAWSPTERWAMLATARGSVYLFRPNTGDARLRRLDISAADLAWR